MKVGLLECDHVREELVHIAGDYRQIFPALFLQVAPDWEFHFYDVCNGHFPESVDDCDVYICTGSKSSIYDNEPWIEKLKDFVRQISKSHSAFVGVCFGHQLLGEALGGKVKKSARGWCVGIHTLKLLEEESWMQPCQGELNLLMMCQDQVLQLPPDSKLLASADDCPNAMFLVGDKMLGIQAHPEFSRQYNKGLMELRVERIGAEKVQQGIASLDQHSDELIFAEWVHKFVAHAFR
ncbi:MAG TPA: amidotransferase [Dyadobacter sp.]|jgi:GMP synthase-like glutamine amidotransferase|nr:amidotransferase [Dyadobacter sp.]